MAIRAFSFVETKDNVDISGTRIRITTLLWPTGEHNTSMLYLFAWLSNGSNDFSSAV